jgi:hypothetical protein
VAGLLLVLVVATGVQQQLVNASLRWQDPMANVIMRRMLPDPERKAYLTAHGMPDDAVVRSFSGELWFHTKYRQHAPLVNWLRKDGKRTYIGYLLSHPLASNGEMLAALPEYFTLSDFKRKWLHDEPGTLFQPLTFALNQVFFFRLPTVWFAPAWAALAVILALIPSRRARPVAMVTLFLGAAAYTQVFVGYHGDAADEGRHLVVGQLLFRLSLLSGMLAVWRLARPNPHPAGAHENHV